MKKTFHGSCHCGAVRFECELDLASGTTRCNCRFCKKARFWMAFAQAAEFRVLSGAESLSDYQHVTVGKSEPFLHFQFCKTCGVRGFTKGGVMPQFPGGFYAVNLASLDDATDAELAAAPIQYADGRNDAWHVDASDTRYL